MVSALLTSGRRWWRQAGLTLEEDLEHGSRLLVDEARDTLDSTSSRETADGRLCDSLDVVAEDLAVCSGGGVMPGAGDCIQPRERGLMHKQQQAVGSDKMMLTHVAWLLPFQVPCRPFLVQTLLLLM